MQFLLTESGNDGLIVEEREIRMCARYSLTKEEITLIIGEIEVVINILARYNIAPSHPQKLNQPIYARKEIVREVQ
jgi:hypothetical protein